MSWKILLVSARLLFWVAVVWVLFRKSDARRPACTYSDGRVEFARHWFAYPAWILITVDFAWWAAKDLISSKGKPTALVNGIGLGLLAVILLIEFPGTIVLTKNGIEESFWLRRNKRIQWKDIVEINTGKKSCTVTVTSADGTTIVHSAQLADRARFLLELKQHCGENLPPDFPREPLTS